MLTGVSSLPVNIRVSDNKGLVRRGLNLHKSSKMRNYIYNINNIT